MYFEWGIMVWYMCDADMGWDMELNSTGCVCLCARACVCMHARLCICMYVYTLLFLARKSNGTEC